MSKAALINYLFRDTWESVKSFFSWKFHEKWVHLSIMKKSNLDIR